MKKIAKLVRRPWGVIVMWFLAWVMGLLMGNPPGKWGSFVGGAVIFGFFLWWCFAMSNDWFKEEEDD